MMSVKTTGIEHLGIMVRDVDGIVLEIKGRS